MFAFANPTRLLALTEALKTPLLLAFLASLAFGLYFSFTSPPDYQQGEMVRVMYIHVPAAQMAMGIYIAIGLASAAFLIWKHHTAYLAARAMAPVGAAFTLLCMATGAIWGKPMWGAWWVWDARLTSVLVLFFLYVGYIALGDALSYSERSAKAASILALIGLANLPVIRFSVEWWNTLHQPATLIRSEGPAIQDPQMLTALLVMSLAFALLTAWLTCLRIATALYYTKRRRER